MRKYAPQDRGLEYKAIRMKRQGYDPVQIQKRGCALKLKPHVCANCIIERKA